MNARLVLLVSSGLLVSGSLQAGPIGYIQTNLVSDGVVPATTIDPDLKNAWGISFGPSTPFWVVDNETGLSTLYRGDGSKLGLVVTIPPAAGSPTGTTAAPTGTVFNGTPGFMSDRFLFAAEDGTISGWQGSLGTNAALRVDNSASDAIYKGLAIDGLRIYATDFHNGKVDVWDNNYASVSLGGSAFTDPNLPSGYAPFGIQNIGGFLYVTFAKQGPGGDDEAGPGFGFVDKFDADGALLQRVVVGVPGDPNSPLNSPWGLALAPANFGPLSNLLLVGNFGDGLINAFDPGTGAFVGSLNDPAGHPIAIDGLWGLAFGNNGPGFSPNKLYFTAGPNDEADGLFGSLEPVPEPGSMLLMGAGLVWLAAFRLRRSV